MVMVSSSTLRRENVLGCVFGGLFYAFFFACVFGVTWVEIY